MTRDPLRALSRNLMMVCLVASAFCGACAAPTNFPAPEKAEIAPQPGTHTEMATFGSGCFWCTEAVFKTLKGVTATESGYSGGTVENPTYEQVITKTTGHAEVVRVTFDPGMISYSELLEVFWQSHDPTTRDRQGRDVGSQYRSVILYHSEHQRELAEHYKAKIDAAQVFRAPVVTEIVPFVAFYPAEEYHQDYFAANPTKPYCRAVIQPKVEKLKTLFHEKVKGE